VRVPEVWICAQHEGGLLAHVSHELLGKGRELAESVHGRLAAVLLGARVDHLIPELFASGADKIYLAQDPHLATYSTLPYARVVSAMVKDFLPEIFIFGATSMGRDLAPRVASHLRVGLTADCTDLRIGDYLDRRSKKRYRNLLHQIRPAFGGNIIATILNQDTRPQMATVREGVMKEAQPQKDCQGEVVTVEPRFKASDFKVHLLEKKEVKRTANLREASIIVSGGAGVGGKKGFDLVRQLAEVLGGAVAGSRAAVDAGYIDHDHQVGQTGTTVRPRLYIACGISGTVQHQAGMSESGKIVAINIDPEAPIFGVAHYGIVGDLQDVVPRMMKVVRSRQTG
jgi:electron transfer flavoprotein alpha subunit